VFRRGNGTEHHADLAPQTRAHALLNVLWKHPRRLTACRRRSKARDRTERGLPPPAPSAYQFAVPPAGRHCRGPLRSRRRVTLRVDTEPLDAGAFPSLCAAVEHRRRYGEAAPRTGPLALPSRRVGRRSVFGQLTTVSTETSDESLSGTVVGHRRALAQRACGLARRPTAARLPRTCALRAVSSNTSGRCGDPRQAAQFSWPSSAATNAGGATSARLGRYE
jgi:hypothetical protein